MRLTGWTTLLLAWAALQAPWLRCVSDCHDTVVLALADHAHHEGDCGRHGHTRGSTRGDEGAEHELVRFEAPRPTTAPVVVALLPASAVHVALPAPARAASAAAPVRAAPPGPPPRTTVLLL